VILAGCVRAPGLCGFGEGSIGGHVKRSWLMFSWALLSVLLGIFLTVTPLWLASVPMFYAATFWVWRGALCRSEETRRKHEAQWWRRAKTGVTQKPLHPCCLKYEETGFLHDDIRCTRYLNRKPHPKSPEERAEIDPVWKEMISHLRDPEHGEEP
jgi:hypothetical protein